MNNRNISNNDDDVYNINQNRIGINIENDFFYFLLNFELSPNDPNYSAYRDGLYNLQEG